MISKKSGTAISNPYLKKPSARGHSLKTAALRTTITTKTSPTETITTIPPSETKPSKSSISPSLKRSKNIKTEQENTQKILKIRSKDKVDTSKQSSPPNNNDKKPKKTPTPSLKSRLKNEIKQIRQEILRKKREEEAKKKRMKLQQQKEEEERKRKEKEQEILARRIKEDKLLYEEKKEEEILYISNDCGQVISSLSSDQGLINNTVQVDDKVLIVDNYKHPQNFQSNYNGCYTPQVNSLPHPPINYTNQYMHPYQYSPFVEQHAPTSASWTQQALAPNCWQSYSYLKNVAVSPQLPYNYSQYYPYSNHGYYNQPKYQFNAANPSMHYQPPSINQQQQFDNKQIIEEKGTPFINDTSPMPQSHTHENHIKQITKQYTMLPSKSEAPTTQCKNPTLEQQPQIHPFPPLESTSKSDEDILQDLIQMLQSFTLSKDGVIPLIITSSKPFQECMIEDFLSTTLLPYPSSPSYILQIWSRFSKYIEEEGQCRYELYWREQWRHECQAFGITETIEYMPDARRSYLRNTPRPNVGCKCGATSHDRMYSKECTLYRDLKLISNYNEEESTINQQPQSSITASTAIVDIHKERAKKRMKLEIEEDYKEAKFVNAMETVQYQSLHKAVFAPKYLSIMMISTIMSLQTKTAKQKDIFEVEDEDMPLSALTSTSTDSMSFAQAIKKSISNTDKNAVSIRNLIQSISRTWGHVYQELPSVEYAWLWYLRTHKSNKMTHFQNPRYTSHFLPLEKLHLLLNKEQIHKWPSDEHVISYIISSFRSGIVDELYVLYTLKIISFDVQNGEMSLYTDWHTKVEQVVIEDMYQQQFYKHDICRKFCLQESVCKALSSTWTPKDDNFYYKKDNDACFASLETERRKFEQIYDTAMDKEKGIGTFGFL